jgi:hypothetical protein
MLNKPINSITEEEFEVELKNHDWRYARSDDHNAWHKGRNNFHYLHRVATARPDLQSLFIKYGKENLDMTFKF